MEYFHVCALPLAPGSIVEHGNWGRIIRCYLDIKFPPQLLFMLREQTFELIRLKHFSEKPSRFNSAFVFETLEQARNFKANENRIFDLIYKVELTDPGKPLHLGCMRLIQLPTNGNILPQLEKNAKLYWRGNTIEQPEILTESNIRILEQISNNV